MGKIVAIDFFTVSTVRMRVLFVFIVLEHQRRKALHFGATNHPTAKWVAQHRMNR
jgi:putative transposase